jgi:hypothetical protein
MLEISALRKDIRHQRQTRRDDERAHPRADRVAAASNRHWLWRGAGSRPALSLHIHHDGLAKAEIGLWDSVGNVRVFRSQDDMKPPKAVLHAMLEAELGEI